MSHDKHPEWGLEQERVNSIVTEIDQKMMLLQEKGGNVRKDVKELRETFWSDVTVNMDEPDDVIETHTSLRQQAELLGERERNHTHIHRQMQTLTRLKYSPYFGRIDFFEDGERAAETIYIGIASFMDQDDQEFLIYDWRAPISSLYYDFPPGPAHYKTPIGTISGEMNLKRQFIIKDSQITGMFDSGVTIRDEMLQAVLGNNADTQMKSIVATIQKEQNEIIRNERSQIVVVQGVAGSGKTSAALQRVAYLLYRYRNTLSPENIILFSPNPLFNSYISTVLPELGEENMQQSTFQEYLDQRLSKAFMLEDPFNQIEYLLTEKEAPEYQTRLVSIRYKSSMAFKQLIEAHVEELAEKGLFFKPIVFRKKMIVSKEQIYDYFYSLDRGFSIPNRIQLVKEWLFKELKKYAKLEKKKKWVEEAVQFLDKDDFIDAYQKLEEKGFYSANSFDDFEREQELLAEMLVKQKMKPLFNRVKAFHFVDMVAIYQQLFQEENPQPIENWVKICKMTNLNLENKSILYEDATPFVYLQDLILGKRTNSSIRHIFIDEAQDYSPFQLAFIKEMFPYSKMTLLGDINQAIYTESSGTAKSLTERVEQTDSVATYVLNQTYRSTKPIVEFTSYIVEDGEKIVPFNREGTIPVVAILPSKQELHLNLLDQIQQYKKEGHNTIAVICRTALESKNAYAALKDQIPIRLVEKGTIAFEAGVVVIPSYLAKGIEFDAVIIYDSSQYIEESERKLFYTACTRAMHELYIASIVHVSPFMTNIPPDKFVIKDSTDNKVKGLSD
ncbi:RNA polymerase recycling motor HelD [Bacillus sp. T3]|uniref:RNA polymerase recycling motor HelD n=1 Tax=Bacillus sp. T3 TaxID=467262 RepID=UPI0029825580|nr:RNA polymerase recycling motor HelD [Bacillus sp. T3]